MDVGVAVAINSQIFTRNLNSVIDGDMKAAEFNPAFEPCGQSFYDSRPQNGFSVRDGVCQSDPDSKKQDKRNAHNPAPTGPPLFLFRPWFVMTWHAELLER